MHFLICWAGLELRLPSPRHTHFSLTVNCVFFIFEKFNFYFLSVNLHLGTLSSHASVYPTAARKSCVGLKEASLAAGIHDFDNWACCQTINQRLPQLNTCCTLRMQKSKNVFPSTLKCISLLSHPDFSGVKKRWSGGVAGCAGARIKRKPGLRRP